jgi:hypothetical protein
MRRSHRFFVGLALCAGVALGFPASTAEAASVPEPPSTDVEPQLMWDPSVRNEFRWAFAEGRIPTACRDVRAPFPQKVAGMACAVRHVNKPRTLEVASFAGGGGGGGRLVNGEPLVELGPPELSQVPLPGGVVLLATAVGGLAFWRRRAS